VRLFAGIEIDDIVRERAAAIADSARAALDRALSIRWVPPQNLHITLWFFGEVPERGAADILNAIDDPFLASSFDLHVAGLGAFPQSGIPRVLWLGVRSGADSLTRLHAELATRLHPLGLEPERRPLSPHMTLARVKGLRSGARPPEVRALWRDLPGDAGSCRVDALTLFRSRLSPKGAAYEPLVRVPLM
jgi:RNA 2',3'-cyclic 3'-phosphodiesterase